MIFSENVKDQTGTIKATSISSGTSSVLRLRTGSSNSDIGLLSSPPTKPYIAMRAGGKNSYVRLVPPNDEAASKVRTRIGGTTYALAKKGDELTYGNGTGVYEDVTDLYYDPYYSATAISYSFHYLIHSFNANTITINPSDNSYCDILVNRQDRADNFKNSDFTNALSIGDEILIHHSECKVANPSAEVAARKGKWEVRKVIAVNGNESDELWSVPYYEDRATLTLDRAPEIDLENFYVQMAPFVDIGSLTLRRAATITYRPNSNSTTNEIEMENYHGLMEPNFRLFIKEENGKQILYHHSYEQRDFYGTAIPAKTTRLGEIVNVTFNDNSSFDIIGDKDCIYTWGYSPSRHCGGLVPLKISDTLTFMGGSILCPTTGVPCGDSLFLFAKNIVVHDMFYKNTTPII